MHLGGFVNYLKSCIYYVKEYGVVVREWAFPNIRQNFKTHDAYSQFGYLSHLHIKQKIDLNKK